MSRDSEESLFPANSPISQNPYAIASGAIDPHPPQGEDDSRPAGPPEPACSRPKGLARTRLAPSATEVEVRPIKAAEEAERYLAVRDVAERFAVSVQTVWRWSKGSRSFPRPIKLCEGTTRWRMSDLVRFERLHRETGK